MAETINLGIVGIKNMGEYDANTSYEKLNVVTYQGSTYCSLRDTRGNLPTDEDYWQLYAEKGEVGETGPQGPKPVKGVDYWTNEDKQEIEDDLSTVITDEISSSLGALTTATPLVASSVSGMTDTTRIYVNSTDGHWYWYNGSSWIDGGVYQAAEDSDTVQKLQESVLKIEKNLIPSKNLYDKDNVQVHTYGGNRQTFKILNPIIGHYYAVFKRNGDYAYLEPRTLLIQYGATDNVLHQYLNTAYDTYAIESNCTYIVFASVNYTDTPLDDIMIVDITGLQPSDFKYFDNGYYTLGKNTKIEEVKPESIKYVKKYNIYNTDKVLTLQSDSQNYQKQIFYCNVGNKYRFLTSTLQRLTNANYNNKNVIAFIYNADNTTSRAVANPTEDITITENEKRLELFVQNTTSTPYDDIMVLKMDSITDDDISKYGYLPYSYILQTPYYVYSAIENENNIIKPYRGKKILSIGDSYTFQNNYGSKLSEITGCQQTPRGYNGARIFNFVSDQYTPTGGGGQIVQQTFNAELLAPYDIITVMGGVNNYGYSTQPLGTINDPATASGSVYSEIKYVIEKILTLKPSIKIVWCTEPYALTDSNHTQPGGYQPNSQGFTIRDVMNAIIEVCEMYGIPVFDFYANSGWNPLTVKKVNGVLVENKYTYDGLHPKAGVGNGAELLGEQFGMFINTH